MVTLKNLNVKFNDRVVLNNLSHTFLKGKISLILGESGEGKTTLLNCIANLISYDGSVENSARKTSYVFQEDRLIPNLTVLENLTICAPHETVENIEKVLEKVHLFHIRNRYPTSLSMGERQRVSIVRAFINNPDLLLLDEPFSSLDIKNKILCENLLFDLLKDNNLTVVYVSHDYQRALLFCDEVCVLSGGNLICKTVNRRDEKLQLSDVEDFIFETLNVK